MPAVPVFRRKVAPEGKGMRVFIAGGSGVIGRSLVPLLVAAGYRVTALTRSAERAAALQEQGARAVVGDVFDAPGLTALMCAAQPEVVVHQLTAFGAKTHAPGTDPLLETIRIREQGTRHLVAAMQAARANCLVTQSISFVCSPRATRLNAQGLTHETTPFYLQGGLAFRPLLDAVAEMERLTLSTPGVAGLVLRYGWFYGEGTNYDPRTGSIPRGLQKGRSPLVAGDTGTGQGIYSHIAVADAARATLLAIQRHATGIYNIVDDEPVTHQVWMNHLAGLLGAPPPGVMPEVPARAALGEMLTYFMTRQPGASNAKAKRELGWQPQLPSWRDGFAQLYAGAKQMKPVRAS